MPGTPKGLGVPLSDPNRSASPISVGDLGNISHERSDSLPSAVSAVSLGGRNEQSRQAAETLLPKMKTLEMYRLNARKSKDPSVLFEYAQYVLQIALLINGQARASQTPRHSKSRSIFFSPVSSEVNLSDIGEIGDGLSSEKESQLKHELLKESYSYLKKLQDKGYVDAQYLLADAYSMGAFGEVKNKDAFSLFLAAAKHHHVESAYRTALCFEEGRGTGRDARKAVEFLKMAAANKHPAAMYKLGMYSFYSRMGLPNNVNTKKAGIQWLSRAAKQANELICAAPYELGQIYYHGFLDIIIPDKSYAVELYIKAASLGHIKSAALLGRFYELGQIVPQDPDLSIHYYNIAAQAGECDSMLSLCAWYLVGSDKLGKDEHEAYEWALRAANAGLPKAQFAVSHFLEKGIGCTLNKDMSQKWLEKAAASGDERAVAKMSSRGESVQSSKKTDRDCVIV